MGWGRGWALEGGLVTPLAAPPKTLITTPALFFSQPPPPTPAWRIGGLYGAG